MSSGKRSGKERAVRAKGEKEVWQTVFCRTEGFFLKGFYGNKFVKRTGSLFSLGFYGNKFVFFFLRV